MSESVFKVEIKSAERQKIAFCTLNSEKTLNALSAPMIEGLQSSLDEWRQNPEIAAIVLQGAGEKAFCAGGDIRALYEEMILAPLGTPVPKAEEFFKKEYHLDYCIHTYPKPILCLGHGIVMGGGLGLMAGAQNRVVSESSMIAMPEISIGLYPEVGASWFLNRMPGRVGLFLGLSGARLNAADALFVGLADYFIPRAQHQQLLSALLKTSWTQDTKNNQSIMNATLKSFQVVDQIPQSAVRENFDWIQSHTQGESAQVVIEQILSAKTENPWLQKAQKTLAAGSPTSAHLIYEAFYRAKHLSLKEAFDFEFHLSSQVSRRPDFREGIRALIVDKDNKARWTPAQLSEVQNSEIEAHFRRIF